MDAKPSLEPTAKSDTLSHFYPPGVAQYDAARRSMHEHEISELFSHYQGLIDENPFEQEIKGQLRGRVPALEPSYPVVYAKCHSEDLYYLDDLFDSEQTWLYLRFQSGIESDFRKNSLSVLLLI